MHYIKAYSAGKLFPVVQKYMVSAQDNTGKCEWPVFPCDQVYLIYAHANSASLMYKNHREKVSTCIGIGGLICREQILVQCSGFAEFIFVELHPIALYYLYRNSLRIFTDRFTAVAQRPELELTQKLLYAPDLQVRLCILQNFLEAHLPIHQILNDKIFQLTQWIIQKGGQIKISKLAEQTGLSGRQMERVFLEKIGVTPKHYAKLVQMRMAVNGIMEGNKQTADIVFDHGYYDAAHFNKDFRRFLGMNPTEFMREGTPMLKAYVKSEAQPSE